MQDRQHNLLRWFVDGEEIEGCRMAIPEGKLMPAVSGNGIWRLQSWSP